MSVAQNRVIPDRLTSGFSRAARSWETLLLIVVVAIFIVNSFASPYFLDPWNLSDATFNFTEKAMIAFAMAMLIVAGDIDLSVAAIIALASTAMGLAMEAGVGVPGLVAVGIVTGIACGAVNGGLVAGMGLPSIVVSVISSWATKPSPDTRLSLPISGKVTFGGCCHSNWFCLPRWLWCFGRCCTAPILAAPFMPLATTRRLRCFPAFGWIGFGLSCSC